MTGWIFVTVLVGLSPHWGHLRFSGAKIGTDLPAREIGMVLS